MLSLAPTILPAQEAMIETTVKDTATVYPNQFEYHFKFIMHPDYHPDDEEFSLDKRQKQTRRNEEKLKELLPQYDFAYNELSNPLGNRISVTINEEDIDRFSQMLGEFGRSELSYKIHEDRYDSLEKLEESWNKKLLDQARKKIQALSKLAGLSVSKINEIVDKPMREKVHEKSDEKGWVVYPPLSPQEMFLEIMKHRRIITYEKELTIRFSTE